MSKRQPLHVTKILLSYWVSCLMKRFRDAIENEHVPNILNSAIQQPRLLNESIDRHGNTALGLAIQLGRIKAIKVLLKLGSNPNVANVKDGTHPLCLMAKLSSYNNPKIVTMTKMLLEAGSNPFYQPNHSKHSKGLRMSSIADTPLLLCIRLQNEDLLKIYIDHKINLNTVQSNTFMSPLMLAAILGSYQMCKLLLDAGANLNASNWDGNTPLHLAIRHPSIIELLLDYGADIGILNDDGYTPYELAQHLSQKKL